MQINLIRQILPEVFADDLEQKMFLYLMDNFQVSHSQLSRAFGISRTKVYSILDSWENLGLVSILKLPKENRIQLGNLQILQDIIATKQQKLTELQLQLHKRDSENFFVVRDKVDQVNLFDQILADNKRLKQDIHHFGDMDKIVLMLGIDWANYYIDLRIKMGIKSMDIVTPSSFLDLKQKKTNPIEIREVKYTCQKDLDQGYIPCNNKIYHLDYRHQSILVYNNSANYKLLESNFDLAWSTLDLV